MLLVSSSRQARTTPHRVDVCNILKFELDKVVRLCAFISCSHRPVSLCISDGSAIINEEHVVISRVGGQDRLKVIHVSLADRVKYSRFRLTGATQG